MSTKYSKYPYVLAVIFGIFPFFIPDISEKSLLILLGLIYLLGGCLFGFFWPRESWRWGLWILGPLISFFVISILFAGQFKIIIKELLIALLIIVIPCVGSFFGAWFKQRRIKPANTQNV